MEDWKHLYIIIFKQHDLQTSASSVHFTYFLGKMQVSFGQVVFIQTSHWLETTLKLDAIVITFPFLMSSSSSQSFPVSNEQSSL